MKTGHRSSAPTQSYQRPPLGVGAVQRARHFNSDPALQRRPERYVAWAPRPNDDADRIGELRRARIALQISSGLLIATALGSFLFLYNVFGTSPRVGQQTALQSLDDNAREFPGKYGATSTSVRAKDDLASADAEPLAQPPRNNEATITPAEIIARGWSAFEQKTDRVAKQDRGSKTDRLASAPPLETPEPQLSTRPQPVPVSPRNTFNREAKTTLVDFESAPFPYNGNMPASDRRFLDSGEGANRAHTNFRGRVLKEADVFNDRRALLHIPQGFDANKPGVIVVFFHGHGANLTDDVRDRQLVPQQISTSGVNAVMIAPQFAVNAADSSAGKFWEKDGFKRFMDESAKQFAKLSGDPRTARAFAKMPIVIVAYSGGFGPTLSVLDRGGVNQRIRGIVLLDALYTGAEKFADWIASNRSAFFVSSYTPHTRRLNTELERLLADKSIAYGSELRPNRLPGSVTFLPAGDISHRDFVTHAWADYPIRDILVRLDNAGPASNATPPDANSKFFVARR